jgi:hypothetical protein
MRPVPRRILLASLAVTFLSCGGVGPDRSDGAPTRTLSSPDGRTVTVTVVPHCQCGPVRGCPTTYAEALADITTGVDGRLYMRGGAGRCAEGNYVYYPYFDDLGAEVCYYDSAQQRAGHLFCIDTMSECGPPCGEQNGTGSNCFADGDLLPCTTIVWDAHE